MKDYQDDDFLSINETAKVLNVSRSTIIRMINNHEIKYYEIRPSVKRIKYKDIKHLLCKAYRC